MNNSMRFRLGLVLALAALLAGCEGPCSKVATINAPGLDANGVDLTTYVAVGTSLSSGYESGGIVDRHQVHSFPALFAQQIGKTVTILGGNGTFTQPTVNGDGIDTLLSIKSLSPLVINRHNRTQGAPTNFTQNSAYHNLGIPGAILLDLVDSSFYHSAPPQLRQSFVMFDIIQRRRGTVLQQALSLSPTLISLEYGANELLGPATQGSAPSSTTGADFRTLLAASLDAIHAASPNTRVAVFNIPDVTSIPFFTTFPAFTVSTTTGQPVPLVGVNGPCQLGDLITLPASAAIAAGTGIPAGGYNYLNPAAGSNGQPLPEALILRAAEVAVAQTQVAQMNAAVDDEALRPYVAKVDIHDLLVNIARNGIQLGGNLYTSDFITGGLFSLDGVHPNDLGYALMANQLIDGVNARFGSRIPRLNPLDHATTNASNLRLATKDPAYPMRIDGLRESFEKYFPH